jgi:hypothetical protein
MKKAFLHLTSSKAFPFLYVFCLVLLYFSALALGSFVDWGKGPSWGVVLLVVALVVTLIFALFMSILFMMFWHLPNGAAKETNLYFWYLLLTVVSLLVAWAFSGIIVLVAPSSFFSFGGWTSLVLSFLSFLVISLSVIASRIRHKIGYGIR